MLIWVLNEPLRSSSGAEGTRSHVTGPMLGGIWETYTAPTAPEERGHGLCGGHPPSTECKYSASCLKEGGTAAEGRLGLLGSSGDHELFSQLEASPGQAPIPSCYPFIQDGASCLAQGSVARTRPLSTGAKQKRRSRVLGEGKKHSFYCFARQRRPEQSNALKTGPSLGEELQGVL